LSQGGAQLRLANPQGITGFVHGPRGAQGAQPEDQRAQADTGGGYGYPTPEHRHAINAAAPERPPAWAEVVRSDDGWRYRHRLCGREIHEDERVDSFRAGYTLHDGRKLEYIEEVWTTEEGTPRTTVVFPGAAVGGLDDWFLSSLAEACVVEGLTPSGILRTDEFIFVDMA